MKPSHFGMLSLVLALLLATVPGRAQQSIAEQYDTKKLITLTGTVNGMWFASNVPFWIVLETKKADGKKQRWVVVGKTMDALRAAGWVFAPPPSGTLNIDEEVTVAAYLPKVSSKVSDELAAASPQIAGDLKNARLAHGTEITLPNGKKVTFGASQ